LALLHSFSDDGNYAVNTVCECGKSVPGISRRDQWRWGTTRKDGKGQPKEAGSVASGEEVYDNDGAVLRQVRGYEQGGHSSVLNTVGRDTVW